MSRPRRGVSLLELLAIITFGVILLGLGARTLVALIRVDRGGRERLADDASILLLTRDFRADLHASDSAEILGPSAAAVELKIGANRVIRYQAEGDEVVRSERLGDQNVGRRVYRRNGRLGPTFERLGDAPTGLIRLRLLPPKVAARGTTDREVVVEARTGWDRRFGSPKGGADAGRN